MALEPVELEKEALLKHYGQDFVQKAIMANSKDKEVVGSYGGVGYAKRPDTLNYAGDILELVKSGITSFHSSEENWSNPFRLNPNLKKSEIDDLRKGWDLIIDIDCKFLEYSGMAAHYIIEFLKYKGMKAVSVKFSGNHGFHIGVPFEAFPLSVKGQETRLLFPEAPRRISLYIKEMIRKHLAKKILETDNIGTIMEKTEKGQDELIRAGELDPFSFLELDTILISSRHLCRMIYSVNEKSGLVSIPVDPEKILEFDKKAAVLGEVRESPFPFLNRENIEVGEAKSLLEGAFDFKPAVEEEAHTIEKEYDIPETALPEDLFPPCINNILKGLQDGKKRSLFILKNFLGCAGWSFEQIEELVKDWNERNSEPLRETVVVGQLRTIKQQKKKIPPPNCNNNMYYKDLGLCTPDGLCAKIKNPIKYATVKSILLNQEKKTSRKLTEEEKERRRIIREKQKKFKEEMLMKREKNGSASSPDQED